MATIQSRRRGGLVCCVEIMKRGGVCEVGATLLSGDSFFSQWGSNIEMRAREVSSMRACIRIRGFAIVIEGSEFSKIAGRIFVTYKFLKFKYIFNSKSFKKVLKNPK